MNTRRRRPNARVLLALIAALAGGGCSHAKTEAIASVGPTVFDARAIPGTIELNRELQPLQPPIVTANVKDLKAPVTNVTLRFNNVPITIPMANIGGTRWQAQLTPRELEMMAVSGRTVHYEARVIAKDSEGYTASSPDPLTISIRSSS